MPGSMRTEWAALALALAWCGVAAAVDVDDDEEGLGPDHPLHPG